MRLRRLLFPDLVVKALINPELIIVVGVERLSGLRLVEVVRLLGEGATRSSTLIMCHTATVVLALGVVAVLQREVARVVAGVERRRPILILL